MSRRAGNPGTPRRKPVQRTQLGCRVDRNLVKIFRAYADYHDMTLGENVEIVLVKALKGEPALNVEDIAVLEKLIKVFELDEDLYIRSSSDS